MRLLAFDLDGTLADSVPDIAAAVNRMLADRNLPPLGEPAIAAMVGDGLQPLIDRVFDSLGAQQDQLAAQDYLADYEANVSQRTRLFPGIVDALAGLAGRGWRLAVCTNKPARAARLLLEALGVADRFAAIGGGDSFAAHKPNPEHLRKTVEAAGCPLACSLMVGDHTNDMLAAMGCGVPAIFAGWGYGRPGMAQGAAAIAQEPRDLLEIAEALLPA